jgi:transcriptional regulator with XRE-family HTH domain
MDMGKEKTLERTRIIARIREQMELQGVTQAVLASRVGVTSQRINEILNRPEKQNLELNTLLRVAAALDCDLHVEFRRQR